MNNQNGAVKATINDIAYEAGVSISTVSRVLNGTVPVALETAERVWKAVDRLQYTPNSAAKSLASKRKNTIGLLLPEISGLFFSPMLRGIERCARQQGFDLLIYSSSLNEQQELIHRRPLGEHNTDGLLVFTNSLNDRELALFHKRGFPFVLLHRSAPPGMEIPAVTFENQTGSERMIDHLIQVHGCQRIAFLRGPAGNEDSHWREAGYRAALNRHGITVCDRLFEHGDFDTQHAVQATQKLLDQGVAFDAVFAGDDEAAAGVFLALTQRGIRVPEEVRIVGFDDNYIAPLLPTPLTTVRAPIEEAGYEAARQLISLIQTGKAEKQVIFPTELVIRRSCGCSPNGA